MPVPIMAVKIMMLSCDVASDNSNVPETRTSMPAIASSRRIPD